MVSKEKAAKREIIRLRKRQNPQQVDSRRMRKLRKARAELCSSRKPVVVRPTIVREEKKEKAKKPRKKKEPELEIIEDEPELEIIDEVADPIVVEEKKKAKKPKKEEKPKKPKRKKEPELEVIEEEPEIDPELADLYTYDEEIEDE